MTVLVFAPHNDDEVLGVGGTMAKLAAAGHEVVVCEVTSGTDAALVQRIKDEALCAHRILGVARTIFLDLPVVGLRETPLAKLNGAVRDAVQETKPQLVFLPHKGDMHSDHAEVTKSAMVALRPVENPQLKAVYAYETLSETEWNTPTVDNAFLPNVYCDISLTLEQKLDAMRCYQTQIKEFPNPRSIEAMEALARLRGSTICVPAAESFMLMRDIL